MSDTQKIIPVEIVDEMQKSFLDYSMSVIVARALPDVRDGLKPVHRRILYTMYENGLSPDKPHRKCADTVGSVLGRYHPHGDASVYDALVRMAQDFSLRYPLVDGHGNFGSIDGYPAAAYRYTEARMSKVATRMMAEIEKETVDFVRNYDDRLDEPTVLPARIPGLLVNGSSGIAVGMATNIPPHNLHEVVMGMCALIDNPDIAMEELCEHIQGPDFPTGGIIMGKAGIRAAYATGRGRVIVRARTEIEECANGRYRIIITEIPYMVNKQNLVKYISDLITDKRIEGIDDIVDHSQKKIRVVIDLKKDANAQVVLNQLFRYTQMQTTFGVIMLALVNGEPKILTLKEMLQHYIDFQVEIVTRRTIYDLRKAEERAHILEGLKIALDFIDEVIAILRASKTIPEGKEKLMERFGLDDVQATAIVQMTLGRLTGLERTKIEEELETLRATIADLQDILANHSRILSIIKEEALSIHDRFMDDRRTEITAVSGEVDIEDLIPVEECVLTLTEMGYIKRLPADTYKAQRRGGRGVSGMTTREEDLAEYMFICSSHDYVCFFSNKGRVYRLKAYEIPEGSRTAKGLNIINLLPLEGDEKITAMIRVSEYEEDKYLCMITKRGVIKRTSLKRFDSARKAGLIALSLDEGDELRWVRMTGGTDDLIIATRKGMAIRIYEGDLRPLGRTARGVRSIRLRREGDEVVGMSVLREGAMLLTVAETGFGRRSELTDYHVQSRGGLGRINYRVGAYGDVAGIKVVDEDDDLILISSDGIVIRMPVAQISICARPGKGVKVMRVAAGEKVVTLARAPHEEEVPETDDEDGEEAVDGGETTVDLADESVAELIDADAENVDTDDEEIDEADFDDEEEEETDEEDDDTNEE